MQGFMSGFRQGFIAVVALLLLFVLWTASQKGRYQCTVFQDSLVVLDTVRGKYYVGASDDMGHMHWTIETDLIRGRSAVREWRNFDHKKKWERESKEGHGGEGDHERDTKR